MTGADYMPPPRATNGSAETKPAEDAKSNHDVEFTGTPHINAKKGDFAETCLLPGDPARAEWIAKTFLQDYKEVTSIRRMSGFTGTYKGKRVSVMATGMGAPSCTIYATELCKFYGVKNLIRVGTCGTGLDHVKVGDLIICMAASTDSGMQGVRFCTSKASYNLTPCADWGLLKGAAAAAESRKTPHHVGAVFSSDQFYSPDLEVNDMLWANGFLGVEMEANAVYSVAATHGCKALALVTVSDHLKTGDKMTPEDRQTKLENMTGVALDAAISLA
eukprot:gnl/TRDRNA2_/TRDRNA2_175984_c0_seq5.p1 gnl/TRDRNA2_/TRDRNA2_175984_c0~~gnl/TRDRNA2_/TRDRNA2_175984_c0_seq5.p1  ORF type:complete len:275 (+),score=54.51 gnl/TRDRNA2_/TRDRNA2_175984_c0_seq5:96-920(+)